VVVESLTKGRDPSGTCVLLYAVGPSGLREEGRTEVESQGFVNDTGVIGSRRAVLVGGYAGSARIVEFPEVTTAPPAPSPR
jgi:hypothetical protein